MEVKDLEKLNALNNEIKELDHFIYVASKVWTGKIGLKKLVSHGYGAFNSREFEMNTTIKNRILDVLEKYRLELEEQFKSL